MSELAGIIKSENVVPLEGCTNVWCISGSGKDGLVLINIITTEDRPDWITATTLIGQFPVNPKDSAATFGIPVELPNSRPLRNLERQRHSNQS